MKFRIRVRRAEPVIIEAPDDREAMAYAYWLAAYDLGHEHGYTGAPYAEPHEILRDAAAVVSVEPVAPLKLHVP